MQITAIKAREILDSRGNPTVEADVFLENNVCGRASVPSGASTGSREACEIRDNDPKRFSGKGVLNAVNHVNHEINNYLKATSIYDLNLIDSKLRELDGTENKSRLGANALLAVSLACARAKANALNKPLYEILKQNEAINMPIPMMNILNGGAHADNNVDIQEFMIMPIGAINFKQALQMGAEIFHALKSVLKEQGLNTAVGDEGGFAPDLRSNQHALDVLSLAVSRAGYALGTDIVFTLDIAASELFREGLYHLSSEKQQLTAEGLVNYYVELVKNNPIASIEDGLDESDWQGWKTLTEVLGDKIQLVGDDLFVTNSRILEKGIRGEIANAILIKPNQLI